MTQDTHHKAPPAVGCRVRLFGLVPKREPCPPEGNWYVLAPHAHTVGSVLEMFALEGDNLTVLKNGHHAQRRAKVGPGDELHIFLKHFGG